MTFLSPTLPSFCSVISLPSSQVYCYCLLHEYGRNQAEQRKKNHKAFKMKIRSAKVQSYAPVFASSLPKPPPPFIASFWTEKRKHSVFFLKKQGFHGVKNFSTIFLMKDNCFSPLRNRKQFPIPLNHAIRYYRLFQSRTRDKHRIWFPSGNPSAESLPCIQYSLFLFVLCYEAHVIASQQQRLFKNKSIRSAVVPYDQRYSICIC